MGFYVQDVLSEQLKIFILGKKDWKIKNTALRLLLRLMFCKSFAAFCFFPAYHTVYILSRGMEYAGLLAEHKGYINRSLLLKDEYYPPEHSEGCYYSTSS